MNSEPDAAMFGGLRVGLHLLVAGLTLLAVVRVFVVDDAEALVVLGLAAAFLGTYAVGRLLLVRGLHRIWLIALTLEWLALMSMTPEAAYLVFPLFFLYLHLLPGRTGPLVVLLAATLAIVAIGSHDGLTVGAVIGPLVAALVAIAIGLGYRALYHESAERKRLIDELLAAQEQLSASERDKGMLSERTRLAGEIHDTVAQGLSSIQMLLHAAERANPEGPGIEHVRLARQTAADNLAEARRFVRELTPPTLVNESLAGALGRLGLAGPPVAELTISGQTRSLPMPVETAMLRIAQSALANAGKHAAADAIAIELAYRPNGIQMTISDDGVGFNVDDLVAKSDERAFGLDVMRRRMAELGGRLVVDSQIGRGTTVTATIEVDP